MDRVVVVTGISGAGKSTVSKALEDLGYTVVDNVPVQLFSDLLRVYESMEGVSSLAVVVDSRGLRNTDDVERFIAQLSRLKEKMPVSIVFLDASTDALMARFNLTRHLHPMARSSASPLALVEAIEQEKELLAALRAVSDVVIDTTGMKERDLVFHVSELIGQERGPEFYIVSFSYQRGLPSNADLVYDARVLRNPYYIEELKQQTGLDKGVADYVRNDAPYQEFLNLWLSLIRSTYREHRKQGKQYLTVAIGCTGGQHRSVLVAMDLYGRLKNDGHKVLVWHRELGHVLE
ncbi:RNase adapter RapZ [Coprothermobacteraceae bacterium]|nr:RNase adapter RapZ [Coprothermobacteraceae bacterium]